MTTLERDTVTRIILILCDTKKKDVDNVRSTTNRSLFKKFNYTEQGTDDVASPSKEL